MPFRVKTPPPKPPRLHATPPTSTVPLKTTAAATAAEAETSEATTMTEAGLYKTNKKKKKQLQFHSPLVLKTRKSPMTLTFDSQHEKQSISYDDNNDNNDNSNDVGDDDDNEMKNFYQHGVEQQSLQPREKTKKLEPYKSHYVDNVNRTEIKSLSSSLSYSMPKTKEDMQPSNNLTLKKSVKSFCPASNSNTTAIATTTATFTTASDNVRNHVTKTTATPTLETAAVVVATTRATSSSLSVSIVTTAVSSMPKCATTTTTTAVALATRKTSTTASVVASASRGSITLGKNIKSGTGSNRLAQGCTSLMFACQHGDIAVVLEQMRSKPERLRLRDSHNKNALHYCAAHTGDLVAAASIAVAAPELLESADEDGFTPLHLAVIQGNLAMVNLLLANKADVNAVDKEGHSVVHWATVCGEVGALRSVLAAGANVATPDINGGSPLHYAAQMCGASYEGKLSPNKSSKLALEILSILLAHPQCSVDVQDKDGRQPLLWAASAGSAKAVIALVKAGARVESADKDGLTALHCAASRGHTECIDTLISLCGAPTDLIDSNGCTALHYAVTLGHADATSRLLDFEADPNRQDRKGRTPAHCGCAKGQFETVKLLKERNANLWLRNAKGDLPLHEAATSGRRELVEWLLEQRPKQVNTTSNDGRSLLHIAAYHDYTDLCKLLLDYKADVNAVYRNNKGLVITPLDCALQKGHRSTAKFLQSHGGLPSGKLRLAARRANPFTNTPVEIIKPLKYAEKEEIHDLTNSKKYVVYLKRSDSEGGEETNCSCTEQTYRREQRYAHTCRRHHQRHKRHLLRRRTSSCGDPLEFQDDCGNICRSKSNIEIRRRKSRERYSSSSEWEDEGEAEDSCENCCYHKRKKQRVIQRRRSTPSKKSRHAHEPEDKDKTSDAEQEKEQNNLPKSMEDTNIEQQEVKEKEQEKANVPETHAEASLARPDSKGETQNAMPDTPQTAKEGTFIRTPPETPQISKESLQTEASRSPSAAELTDGEEHNQPVMESVLAEVQVHRGAEESEAKEETGNENETPKKESEASTEETIKKEQTGELETTGSSMETKEESTKDGKTSEEMSSEKEKEAEDNEKSKESKEEEADTMSMSMKDSIDTVIEVKPKEEEAKTTPETENSTVEAETLEASEQPIAAETIFKTSSSETEKKSAAEPQKTEENVEAKANEATSKETMPPETQPANTTATSEQDTKDKEDQKKQEQEQEQKQEETIKTEHKQESSETEKRASISKEHAENQNEIKQDPESPEQNERQQESRRSFTLLPSDSAEDEIEIEAEEPARKASFQVLKSDESILEVEESPSPREEHEMSDSTVFKVLTEPHIMSPFEGESMKSEDIIGHTVLEPNEEEEMEQEKRFRIEQSTGSPYDYGSGRKRRLKKRVKSGAKTRGSGSASTWKRSEADGSDMQQNTRDQDSGFEPSPRTMKSKIPTPRNIYTAHIPRRPLYTTLDGRSCSSRLENRKLGDKGACDMSAVTRSIQRNIRRYYMERKIFQHLLELKSLQIRSNKLNEAVLVKRAVDDYHKSCAALGGETGTRLRRYNFTEYTFKNFELFLYETLKALQKPGTYNFQNINEVYEEAERRLSPDYNAYEKALQCTTRTHRCLHAAHAYTGIPCAAYIPMMNHHTMPKFGFGPYKKTGVGSFYLPKILTTGTGCSGKVALELSHGKSKQLISLPSEKLDSNKRYFVTFTVKETEKQQQQQQQQQHHGATNCESASVQCSSTSEQKQ